MIGVMGPSELVQQAMNKTEQATNVRFGTLTVVGASVVTVQVAGGTVRAGYLASYTPTVGHVVALLQTQESWLVLGRVIGPAA